MDTEPTGIWQGLGAGVGRYYCLMGADIPFGVMCFGTRQRWWYLGHYVVHSEMVSFIHAFHLDKNTHEIAGRLLPGSGSPHTVSAVELHLCRTTFPLGHLGDRKALCAPAPKAPSRAPGTRSTLSPTEGGLWGWTAVGRFPQTHIWGAVRAVIIHLQYPPPRV